MSRRAPWIWIAGVAVVLGGVALAARLLLEPSAQPSVSELSKEIPPPRADSPTFEGSPGIVLDRGGSLDGVKLPTGSGSANSSGTR